MVQGSFESSISSSMARTWFSSRSKTCRGCFSFTVFIQGKLFVAGLLPVYFFSTDCILVFFFLFLVIDEILARTNSMFPHVYFNHHMSENGKLSRKSWQLKRFFLFLLFCFWFSIYLQWYDPVPVCRRRQFGLPRNLSIWLNPIYWRIFATNSVLCFCNDSSVPNQIHWSCFLSIV